MVKEFDCTVLEGARTQERQQRLFDKGASRTLKSKHIPFNKSGSVNSSSKAVDVAPFPVDWRDTERFYYFGGYVLGMARQLGIRIRWGGDWDGDRDLKDQSFNDCVHFELVA